MKIHNLKIRVLSYIGLISLLIISFIINPIYIFLVFSLELNIKAKSISKVFNDSELVSNIRLISYILMFFGILLIKLTGLQ